ncbi:MAG: hypothetical protein LBG19_13410 [Prevotellaceae bacterium]|jgi:hypothetical protein|nr:hypothetical protein [Prevotellaceae bacterium]
MKKLLVTLLFTLPFTALAQTGVVPSVGFGQSKFDISDEYKWSYGDVNNKMGFHISFVARQSFGVFFISGISATRTLSRKARRSLSTQRGATGGRRLSLSIAKLLSQHP